MQHVAGRLNGGGAGALGGGCGWAGGAVCSSSRIGGALAGGTGHAAYSSESEGGDGGGEGGGGGGGVPASAEPPSASVPASAEPPPASVPASAEPPAASVPTSAEFLAASVPAWTTEPPHASRGGDKTVFVEKPDTFAARRREWKLELKTYRKRWQDEIAEVNRVAAVKAAEAEAQLRLEVAERRRLKDLRIVARAAEVGWPHHT